MGKTDKWPVCRWPDGLVVVRGRWRFCSWKLQFNLKKFSAHLFHKQRTAEKQFMDGSWHGLEQHRGNSVDPGGGSRWKFYLLSLPFYVSKFYWRMLSVNLGFILHFIHTTSFFQFPTSPVIVGQHYDERRSNREESGNSQKGKKWDG